MLKITDAEGRVTEVKNRIRAFGVRNPLTLSTITGAAGLLIGLLFG